MWSPSDPNPEVGLTPRCSAVFGATVLLLAAAGDSYGQARGQADIAVQGFYQGGNSQSLMNTSGLALRFQDFLPGLGFLNGSLEGYGAQNRLQTGENFLELRGAPWLGRHWTLTGGDFRAAANLVPLPFSNIFTPEIAARGVSIQAQHEDNRYSFFAGEETLTAGPRLPYRILAPQLLIGASVVRTIGRRFQIGGRFLQFSSNPQDIVANPYLFPAGRQVASVRTFSVQSAYSPMKRLKLYAEASRPQAQGQRTLVSSLAGVALETRAFTLRANYAREGVLYFPLASYFSGDRVGPFGEVRYRPWKRLELSASAGDYHNNLEHDSTATTIRDTNTSAGVTISLPWKMYGSGQISTIRFTSQTPGHDPIASHNRLISGTLSRSLRRHSMQVTWRDIKLAAADLAQRQRSTEVGDTFQVKRLFLGAAARLQQTSGSERRDSMYYRASAQGNAGRLSIFANIEIGNDLANRTIFSTNTYSTTVVGASLRLFHGWNLQAEGFHNKLNIDLNPENIFVLQGNGLPLSGTLADVTQWSFFFRLTRQIRWGGGLRAESQDKLINRSAPLMGTVEGVVRLKLQVGQAVAPGIPVSLDGGRVVTTAADGRYRFDEVPEGVHEVDLSATELPAEYDPGPVRKTRVLVQPRRFVRTDFEVLPLVSLEGCVAGPEGVPLEGIVIRLLPGARYTMTAAGGRFAFYNLREGDYQVVIDPKTLPDNAELTSPASADAIVRVGAPLSSLEFSFVVPSQQKIVRKVLDKK
jgi:hypothetical protein